MLLLIGISFSNCHTALMDYEGEAGVYFAVQHPWLSGGGDSVQWEMSPSTEVSFFFTERSDSSVRIRVQLLGNPLPQDRYFRIVVVDTGTTATVNHDYDALEGQYLLAGNRHYTDVKIHLHKQVDLAGKRKSIMLRLEETPDFRLPIDVWHPWPSQHTWIPAVGADKVNISAIEHTVYISDITVVPTGWNSSYFGAFSKTKLDKMCEVLGLTYDDFSKERMNRVRAESVGLRMAAYLKDFPANDENGPMEMGPSVS